jgi:hypothetical protein
MTARRPRLFFLIAVLLGLEVPPGRPLHADAPFDLPAFPVLAAGPDALVPVLVVPDSGPTPLPPVFAPTPPAGPTALVPESTPGADGVAAWERVDGQPHKVRSRSDVFLGSITSQVTLGDLAASGWEDPLQRREVRREDAWRCPVLGPFALFGQFDLDRGAATVEDLKVEGKTGVACTIPLGNAAEVVLRGGHDVTVNDVLRPGNNARSAWLLEVQARWPLLAGVGLEYEGQAIPALTPLDHDRINQDVRLAFPVGNNGKLKVGARHKWEAAADPKAVTDSMEVYMGLELSR